ncbi:MAG: S8 family serine peptidase [Firmicutes bacterium]|nr:S8 family serine peptidase [Bacillota bacterium]
MFKNRYQKIISFLLLIFFVGFISFCLFHSEVTSFQVVPNEYIYKVDSIDEAYDLADTYNLTLQSITSYNIAIFEANESQNESLLLSEGFQYNSYSSITAPPRQSTTDPYLNQQYSLELTETIDSWPLTEGSSSILIAIIDTGIDSNHVEFVGRISSLSYNTVTSQVGLAAVLDDFGHGTMVAGVIAANKDNSVGIAGITQNTQLLVIKANNAEEGTFKDSEIIEGIYYAVEQGADIINLSLGGSYANSETEVAINYATQQGVIVVAASGNDGTDEPLYPAAFENSLSVGAIDEYQNLASYSNFGDTIDLVAPGSEIITTVPNNGYATVSGTSFAAPHVSGIIALYLSLYPEATLSEIRSKVLLSANDLGAVGLDEYFGYGMINTYDFLTNEYHEVSFVTSPGTAVEPVFVLNGNILPEVNTPTLTNYVFVGWYLDTKFINAFSYSTPITYDLVLYAKYSSAFHTVSFITEGSLVANIIVANEDEFILPTTLLDGFYFRGWYLDSAFEVPFEMSPVESDLTLYAKFEEIIYYDITYMALNEVYSSTLVEALSFLDPSSIDIEGYTFEGWYIDSEFTSIYESGIVTSNITLYAKLSPIMLFISFVSEGDPLEDIFVNYGEIPILPEANNPGEVFAGWFLDSSFVNPYSLFPVQTNLILYARFLPEAIQINLMIDGELYNQLYFLPDDEILLPIPAKTGYEFTGWFEEVSLTTQFLEDTASENITLYGEFEPILYTVRFFGSDLQTVIFTITDIYDTIFSLPTPPTKTSTVSFDYEFIQWSSEISSITESIDIYPVFNKIFIPSSVELIHGVDTIYQFSSFVDAGIHLLDSTLSMQKIGVVNSLISGRYTITYQIKFGLEIVYEIKRIVNVLPTTSPVIIALNEGLSTLFLHDSYIEAGATSNLGTIEIIGSVDSNTSGVYHIIYQVELDGVLYQKSRFVFVLADLEPKTILTLFVAYKEDEWSA